MKAERVEYLDYARGFAVFTMFLQHCMLVYEYTAGESTPLGLLFVLLGTAPAAPVFLFLMGVFLAHSRAPVQKVVKRGLFLIGLGYILSLFRLTIPLLLSGETTFPPGESPLENFFAVDIFHVAGLSFIIGGVIKAISPKRVWFALAAAVLGLSPLLWQQEPLLSPLNLLWGAAPQVYFPLFPWLFYPLVGMGLSEYLMEKAYISQHKKRVVLFLIGTIIVALLLLPITPVGEYQRAGAAIHVGMFAFILLWLLLFRYLEQTAFRRSRVAGLFTFWSHNVTAIYTIQWILFGWGALLFGAASQPDYSAALIGFAVLGITHWIVRSETLRRILPK